jgi:hypothetical protein
LSSVATIDDARIISWQIDSGTVHCTSSFTLVFGFGFSDQHKTQIRLSLEPNHDLLQNAKVEYINHEGEVVRTEAILRHEHKIYKGQAYVRDEQNGQWRSCGWTRITVLRDGLEPLFEGTFVKDGDVHHIKLLSKYRLRKDIDDAEIDFDDPDERMVIYRDSDRFISQTTLLQRSVGNMLSTNEANASICAHDRLEFNMQGRSKPRSFGLDVLGRLVRRQGGDVGGNLATGGSRAQLASTIGETTGCPTTRQVALVAAAADCSYVAKNGNSSATRTNIISIYNQVSDSASLANPGLCCIRGSTQYYTRVE